MKLPCIGILILLLSGCGKTIVRLEAGPAPSKDAGARGWSDASVAQGVDASWAADIGPDSTADGGDEAPSNPFQAIEAVPLQAGTIDGRPYLAAIPRNAYGLAFYFHDRGKDETALERVEVQDLIHRLNQRLVGVVGLQAGGDEPRSWDVNQLSAAENRDWPVLENLRNNLVQTTDLRASGPIYVVGQGNGGTFASLVAYLGTEAGWTVSGALIHGAPLAGGWVTGAYNPTSAFVLSQNDEVANEERLLEQLQSLQARNIPYTLLRCEEKTLHRWRFTRIPGIDQSRSELVFGELADLGIIDREGRRLLSIPEAWVRAARHPFWPETIRPYLPAIEDQLRVVWAARTFCGNHLHSEIAFILP